MFSLIKRISDINGNALYYEKKGDYITVYNNASILKKIIISYEGAAPLFYSTRQGMFLPAYFPYYPIPGKMIFYDIDSQSYIKDISYKAYYDITIKSKMPVIANLPNKERSGTYYHFSGVADGAYILSSLFMDSYNYNNQFEVIYPIMEKRKSDIETIVKEWANDPEQDVDGKIIIHQPYMTNYTSSYISDDTMEIIINVENK